MRPADPIQVQARALGDPTRHGVFRYLADHGPTDVATLTAHFGLNHNAIRQHLARLVESGLVVEQRDPTPRRGRPRILYDVDPAADSRWGVEGPYERLAGLLAEAVRTGESARDVGRAAGRRLADAVAPGGDPIEGIVAAMAAEGFEPERRDRRDGADVFLERCPFVTTAAAEPATVCSLHLGMAEGVAEAIGGVEVDGLVPKDPHVAHCRLRLRAD